MEKAPSTNQYKSVDNFPSLCFSFSPSQESVNGNRRENWQYLLIITLSVAYQQAVGFVCHPPAAPPPDWIDFNFPPRGQGYGTGPNLDSWPLPLPKRDGRRKDKYCRINVLMRPLMNCRWWWPPGTKDYENVMVPLLLGSRMIWSRIHLW